MAQKILSLLGLLGIGTFHKEISERSCMSRPTMSRILSSVPEIHHTVYWQNRRNSFNRLFNLHSKLYFHPFQIPHSVISVVALNLNSYLSVIVSVLNYEDLHLFLLIIHCPTTLH